MRRDLRRGLRLAQLLIAAGAARTAAAQVPWNASRWRIEAESSHVERQAGREGLALHNGTAWLQGVMLRNGIIQFDLYAGPSLGFYGVIFRAVDHTNYEHFYLRPFLSGNPDATQYNPVYHGLSGWQLYTGPRFGLPVTIATDRWIHVELRVRDRRAEVYVDGTSLVFPALQREPVAGAIGLTSSGAPAWFADVVVTPGAPAMDAGEGAPPEPETRSGMIDTWLVSTPFAESQLPADTRIGPALTNGLAWDTLKTTVRGIANLAQLRTRTDSANTVIAALTLRAARAGPARVRFGFSDRVRVYLDGRPVYAGHDEWRSRDYRFLGTVGLFDELVLNLHAGMNRLWFAVSEDFGGWGITAQLLDRNGIVVAAER